VASRDSLANLTVEHCIGNPLLTALSKLFGHAGAIAFISILAELRLSDNSDNFNLNPASS
jgi:hypothetical protein